MRVLQADMYGFTTRPYDEVAVGDIADAAGTAHGLPFHYFGNKRGLYLEALREAVRQLRSAHAIADGGSPRVRLKLMLIAHFEFMRQHTGLATALLRGGIGADPEAWEIFESTRLEAIAWICAVLGLDPKRRALMTMLRALVGALDEATMQWIQSRKSIELGPLIDALLDMLVSAIEGAVRLDPQIDVREALALMRGDDPETRVS
jgi:AcrR family transcriptional regulator